MTQVLELQFATTDGKRQLFRLMHPSRISQ